VLGRLPYYLVSDRPLQSRPHCIRLFDPPSHSFCSCRLDRRELAGIGAVLVTLPVALMPPAASSVRLIGGVEVL